MHETASHTLSDFDMASLLVVAAALLGWANHHFIRLPHVIGLTVMGALAALGRYMALDPERCEGSLKDQPYDIPLLIAQMTEAGLFERIEDDTDRRRAFITLTEKAADAMARYFAELGRNASRLI